MGQIMGKQVSAHFALCAFELRRKPSRLPDAHTWQLCCGCYGRQHWSGSKSQRQRSHLMVPTPALH